MPILLDISRDSQILIFQIGGTFVFLGLTLDIINSHIHSIAMDGYVPCVGNYVCAAAGGDSDVTQREAETDNKREHVEEKTNM